MPKEVIYTDELLVGGEDEGRTVIEVSWSREAGHVQLVTKCVNGLGGRLVEDEGIHYTDGMYAHPNRQAINDLIRHLRRARDQAFGRDE